MGGIQWARRIAMIEPRMDLETRCAVCHAPRYSDVNEEGAWDGTIWRCGSHSGHQSLSYRTKRLLAWHDDGQLIHKDEYAKLLREWIYK